jgi:hypothetical protein
MFIRLLFKWIFLLDSVFVKLVQAQHYALSAMVGIICYQEHVKVVPQFVLRVQQLLVQHVFQAIH